MHRPTPRNGWRGLPFVCVLLTALIGLPATVVSAADVNAVIDFDYQGLPAGTILSSVNADDGAAGVGPIGVNGVLPSDPGVNHALIFDSANPTGGDIDLGTPHSDFSGPGMGPGGAMGSAFENNMELHNLLILGENLIDANSDNLVDDPDDAAENDMILHFDFSSITAPFIPTNVCVTAIKTIDGEASETPGTLRAYDSSNALIGTFPLVATGCNGVFRHVIGAPGVGVCGVDRIEVELDGSGAIDNIEFKISGSMPDPTCDITPTNMFTVDVGEPVTFTITGTSNADDCDGNGIPDACEPDCNGNGVPDACDLGPLSTEINGCSPLGYWKFDGNAIDETGTGNGTLQNGATATGTGFFLGEQALDLDGVDDFVEVAHNTAYEVNQGTIQLWFKSCNVWPHQGLFSKDSNGFDNGGHIHMYTESGRLKLRIQDTMTSYHLMVSSAVLTEDKWFHAAVTFGPAGVHLYLNGELVDVHMYMGGIAANDEPIVIGANSWNSGNQSATPTSNHFCGQMSHVAFCGSQLSGSEVATLAAVDMNGNGIPDMCEECSSSATVHWNLDKCASFVGGSGAASPSSYKEFTADVSGVCSASVDKTSKVHRASGDHSCTDDRFGAAGDAMCIGAPDIAAFVDDHPNAVRFSVDLDAGTAITGLSFYDFAPLTYIWSHDSGSTSGPNNPPTLYGIRVLKNGTEIFKQVDISTSSSWTVNLFDFTMDADFASTSNSTSFEFELLPYALTGNGATVTAWDLDDIVLDICCDDCDADGIADTAEIDCEPDGIPDDCAVAPDCDGTPGNGEGMILEVTGLPAGAMMTPGLPLGPVASPISSTFTWTPGPGDEGSYTITYTVTDGMDCLPSTTKQCQVQITVLCSLSVADPSDQTVCEGDSATFSVVATGTAPITYQWRKNGSNIPGATSSSLTINPAMSSDAGSYDCVVTNPCEVITSGAATLTVNTDAVVVTSPTDETACEGQSVTFTASADGIPTPTFQWRKDGTNLPGETSATLTINPVASADAGSYDVVVSNICDTDTSSPAVLTVRTAPAVTTSPGNVDVCSGGSASFAVTATGSTPLTYQWRKNGMNIPGATGAMLNINPVGTGDAGTYDVVVSNDCGSATSGGAVLTVNSAPTVTADPTGGTLCEGDPITFNVTATGTAPLSYQWRKDGTAIPGATGASYAIAAAATGDAGSYDVVVTNLCGGATSAAAVLIVRTAPAITADPVDVTICSGASATFDVTATGSAPLSYQWRKDGSNIPGANAATYTINPATAADAGTYDVVVTNDCGMATSGGALLVVNDAPQVTVDPTGGTLCEGQPLSLMVTATGTAPLSYQWRKDGTAIPGATGASFSIPAVATGDAGSYDVVVTNLCGSDTSGPAVVVVRTAPAITTQPVSQMSCTGQSVSFMVVASGSAPLTYSWSKDGTTIPGATSATLTINPTAVADAGTYTVTVSNDCGSATSDGAVLTVNESPMIMVGPAGGTRCEGDMMVFTVTATGSPPLSYQWRKDGTNIPGATGSSLTLNPVSVADGGSYDVVVTNICGDATSAPAVLVVQTAPTIMSQPQSTDACAGEMVIFTVSASGSAPLSYQWSKDGTTIPGATGSSLTINPVTSADAGTYSVLVTNVCGMVTSLDAVLTVNEPPAITTATITGGHTDVPNGTTACPGGSVSFSATASGTAPLTFQWRKDGVAIPGATMSTFSINPVTAADAGVYDVVVTNACGDATSAGLTLTVSIPVSIDVDPTDASVCVGDMASFTVTASGDAPLTYQWRKDGMDIPGANAATLTINPVGVGDGGSYDVVVSNVCGSATSGAGLLTVADPPAVTVDPTGMTVCDGASVTFNVTATGTAPLTYQWRKDGTAIPGATDASLTINPVSAADAGSYDVVVSNACGSATSGAAPLTVQTGPSITLDPASTTGCPGDSVTFMGSATGDPAPTLQWQFNGMDIPGATGTSFTINPVSAADAGTYTLVATNTCGSATSAGAVLSVNDPVAISLNPAGATVCVGDPVTFSVTATGTGPLTYQWRQNGTDLPGETGSSLTIDPVGTGDAGNYDVVVTGACGSETSSVAALAVQEAPVVTMDPVSMFVCDGASVTFTASATGTAPLTYQWKYNGTDIPGAHSDTFTIDPVAPGDTGSYSVMVMNTCGSATSAAADLTVEDPPSITTQPMGANICPPLDSVTLSVTASGTPPFEYRWRKDGTQIPGATGSTLTISPFDAMSDPGSYDVVVSNDCGSVISDPALVEADCDIPFVRGDCNDDGVINIADAVKVLRVLYQGLDVGACIDACDSNDDGLFDISDTIYTVFYQFTGGPPPTSPFPSCGLDPSPDTLECMSFNCP